MKFNTLDAWLDWQSNLHPSEIELGLDRVSEVWQKMQPGRLTPVVITVAGTNGKGSCIAFLDATLRAAGYQVGCYTSPHLTRYNERVRVAGEEASDSQLCDAFTKVDVARGETPLTYFEFGTLAALDIFADAQLDVIVLEVGLGGRLDAVNIIDPDVAVITTIDMDHTDWLGDTKEQIGAEKAGILRQQIPLVFGDPNIPQSVVDAAEALQAPLWLCDRDYGFQRLENGWNWQSRTKSRHALPFPYLRGGFQLKNASTALMVLELVTSRLPLDQRAVRIGLQEAALPGRFQLLGRDPVTVLDVGHNVQAMQTLSDNLSDLFCSGRTLAVFSMLSDKMIGDSIDAIKSRVDEWYVGALPTPRSESPGALTELLVSAGVKQEQVHSFVDIPAAMRAAQGEAGESDRILVFGSFYTVSAVGELL